MTEVSNAPLHLVICGSPRPRGRSAALASSLAERLRRAHPANRVETWGVAGKRIHGCIGCDSCRASGACVFRDDMDGLMELVDEAAELHIVSPVYFAGPPAQLKAVLDRLQPHYWKETRRRVPRPAHLFAVGEGGDPYGFAPLAVVCRSACAVAGFELVDVRARIGRAGVTGTRDAADAGLGIADGRAAVPVSWQELAAQAWRALAPDAIPPAAGEGETV